MTWTVLWYALLSFLILPILAYWISKYATIGHIRGKEFEEKYWSK